MPKRCPDGECLATASWPARIHLGVLCDLDCRAEAGRLWFRGRIPGPSLLFLGGSCCSPRRSQLGCGQRGRIGRSGPGRIGRRPHEHRRSRRFERAYSPELDNPGRSPVAQLWCFASGDRPGRGVFASCHEPGERDSTRCHEPGERDSTRCHEPGERHSTRCHEPGHSDGTGYHGRPVNGCQDPLSGARAAEGRARLTPGGGPAVLQPSRCR